MSAHHEQSQRLFSTVELFARERGFESDGAMPLSDFLDDYLRKLQEELASRENNNFRGKMKDKKSKSKRWSVGQIRKPLASDSEDDDMEKVGKKDINNKEQEGKEREEYEDEEIELAIDLKSLTLQKEAADKQKERKKKRKSVCLIRTPSPSSSEIDDDELIEDKHLTEEEEGDNEEFEEDDEEEEKEETSLKEENTWKLNGEDGGKKKDSQEEEESTYFEEEERAEEWKSDKQENVNMKHDKENNGGNAEEGQEEEKIDFGEPIYSSTQKSRTPQISSDDDDDENFNNFVKSVQTPRKVVATISSDEEDNEDERAKKKGMEIRETSFKQILSIKAFRTPKSKSRREEFFTPQQTPRTQKNKATILDRVTTPKTPASRKTAYNREYKKLRDITAREMFDLFNETVFENKLPKDLPIVFNKRMTKTAGFCYYYVNSLTKVKTAKIELAEKICDSVERLRDTIIHELCHAAAWVINGVKCGHGPIWKHW
eukprot:gene7599-8439_t